MSYNKFDFVQRIFEIILICSVALIVSNNYFYGFDIYLINSHYTFEEYFLIKNNIYLANNSFPSGVEYYQYSILPLFYIFVNIFVNNFLHTQSIITFIEILFFYFSINFFLKNFFGWNLTLKYKILVIFSVIVSEFLFVNLSMLRLPLYEGLHYQFSLSFGLFSIVYLKKENKNNLLIFSILNIILSILFHPMIGIYFFITSCIFILCSKKIYLIKFFLFIPFVIGVWFAINQNCDLVNCFVERINYDEYRKFTSFFSNHQLSINKINLFLNHSIIPLILVLIILNYIIKFELEGNIHLKNLAKTLEIIIYLSFIFTLAPLTEIYFLNITRLYGVSLISVLFFPILIFHIFFNKKNNNFKYFYFLVEIILISKMTIISLIYFVINLTIYEKKNKFFDLKNNFFILILLILFFYLIYNDNISEKINYIKSIIACTSIFVLINFKKIQYEKKINILIILSFLILIKNFIFLNPYKHFHDDEFRIEKQNLIITSSWINQNIESKSVMLIHPDVHDIGLLPFTKIAEFGTPRTMLFKSWNTNRDRNIFERGIKQFCDIARNQCYEYFINSKKLSTKKVSYFIDHYKKNINLLDIETKEILIDYNVNYVLLKNNNITNHEKIIYENTDYIIVSLK
jgi:hypothetical protein